METVWQALSFDGLPLLIVAVFLAGLVRGFAGFGTAMVFVPIAATVISPVWAIIIMITFDLFGPVALLPRAWRDGEPRDVGLLGIGAVIGLSIGIYFLTRMEPNSFRWLVSGLSMTMLVLLISGWRYRNPLNALMTCLVGFISGLLTGIAALPGPPVILSYMSSPRRPEVIRGNTMLYLFFVDVLSIIMFGIKGLLVALPVAIGLILAVPYAIAGLVGARMFDPSKEHIYRRVAYGLIAGSAILGLPIWDAGVQ
tara:strand:+ start:16910 stop:17671 length:762 start_codon:yes stop_codon:yes gene_type:complete